MFVSETTSISH